uniref:Phospholipid/glycerol acyltransferase domain-containing protein n=1 Tax=Meloidogyne enterolobii TaxID=390850 RepID=A0A6V7WR50_MELEN|nr:unnamed protein product [Meloidogyne enterolobii]
MFINSKNYTDFLAEIRTIGGEFTWIRKNNLGKIQNAGRSPKEIATAIFDSERIKKVITDEASRRRVKNDVVYSEAKQILSNMASDFHLHTAVQTIGYSLAKIFGRIFSHIWYNSEALEKIRKISYDRSVSIVWLPTHKSYLDFLLISLLCYHHQIQLPAICAAEDFQSSKLLGEALRRCGAFFIKRKFKEDPIYWAIFAEYIQQHIFHSDRPVEFFIEGQRSRTGKSLFPRTGLLQLVVELFMKAQVYDTLLVPITINYDRILEESLFSYELLGRPKPKESASGLLKARQILSDSFGSIFITIGHPISLREYLLCGNINLEFRGELMNKDKDNLSYDNKLRELTKRLALKIVSTQNCNNVLTIWPFIAVAILKIINDHRRNSQEHFKINITELNPVVEMLVGIFNKCFDGKEIYIEGLMIKDAIMYYLRLHGSYVDFNPNTNSVDFKEMSLTQTSNVVSKYLPTIILLSNYSSISVYSLANFCFFSISENISILPSQVYENFNFLCQLFRTEFVSDPNQIGENFDYAKIKCKHLSKVECHLLAQIMMPYLIAYHAILELFLEMNNEENISNQNEFFTAIHQRLIFKINNGTNKLPLQIASIDLIKNGFNFLGSEQLIKLNQNEPLLVDFAGIGRILKKLDGILRLNFKEFNKELSLRSKI